MHTKPSVLVIEDDGLICESLEHLFQGTDLDFRCYRSAQEFLAEFDPNVAGCILIDIRLPGMTGLELQAKLAELKATQPIIFITAYADVPTVVQAMKAGAHDFFQKPFSPQMLLESVTAAARNHLETRQAKQTRQVARDRMQLLTAREKEVLSMVVAGKPTKVIAIELGLSNKTVDNHRASIMDKMKAEGVVDLVRMVLNLENESLKPDPIPFPTNVIHRAS